MKKAYYIDTFSTQHIHEMYNASSLKMFAAIYEHIEYRCSKSSLEQVKMLLGKLPENVSAKTIPLVNSWGMFGKIKRLLKQIQAVFFNTYFVLFAPKGYDVIINYNTAFALPFVNWGCQISKRRVLQVCHGEMADLAIKRSTSVLFKWGLSLLTNPNVKIAPHLYFAVLGSSIKNNLKGFLSPQAEKKLISFEHSALFDTIPLIPKISSSKLVLGVIGAMRSSKGLENFMKLSELFKGNNHVEFQMIGKAPLDRSVYENSGIVLPSAKSDKYLSRVEMYNHIRQLDYVLFLFPNELYKFTASGSVFDAIDCERPILGLENDYFKGLFNICGDFGYLESNLEGLKKRILWLIDNKERVSWNLKKVKRSFQPEFVAKCFEKIWNVYN